MLKLPLVALSLSLAAAALPAPTTITADLGPMAQDDVFARCPGCSAKPWSDPSTGMNEGVQPYTVPGADVTITNCLLWGQYRVTTTISTLWTDVPPCTPASSPDPHSEKRILGASMPTMVGACNDGVYYQDVRFFEGGPCPHVGQLRAQIQFAGQCAVCQSPGSH
jgi:hypothetical protein